MSTTSAWNSPKTTVTLPSSRCETRSWVSKESVDQHPWLRDVQYDVRDNAIRDFDKARNAHFAKLGKARVSNPSATIACCGVPTWDLPTFLFW
jgi:hypothetical protein